jgi:hypothetical protein
MGSSYLSQWVSIMDLDVHALLDNEVKELRRIFFELIPLKNIVEQSRS